MAKDTDSNDRNHLLIDYLKHLTTLSVVAIVLITAGLQYTFIGLGLSLFVGVAVIGFLVSAVTCVTFFTLLAFSAYDPGSELASLSNRMTVAAAVGAWGGFLLGVIGLVAFTIVRLLQTPIVY